MESTKRKNSPSQFFSISVLLVFLLLWELAVKAGWVSRLFFPPPSKILEALIKLIMNGDMAEAVGTTLLRYMAGLITGSIAGALLGIMMGWWPRLNTFLAPFVAIIYPIPKIAIFPILMIIFGIGEGSKFVVILLAAFFPMLITSMAGVQQINKVYFEVGQNYGARRTQIFTHILLPGSLPSLLAGLRLAANMAFVITVSVEVISASTGLGVLIWFSWQTLRVNELYAVLVVVAMLGLAQSYLLEKLNKKLVPWMGG